MHIANAAVDSQSFLCEFDKKLWTAADKLRSNLDAAVYKHAVLGLIFLKYVSDSFAQRQAEILKESGRLAHPYKTSTGKFIDDALEAIEKEKRAERDRRPRRTARRARAAARINPKPKGVLDRRYTQLQIDPANLIDLIDLIASIPFQPADLHAKDILGHVYDWSGATESLPKESPQGERGGAHQYFLGQFALAEGKKGGHWSGATKTSPQGSPKGWRGGANQYFTPKSIVSLIVEMIEPYQGRVYDPAMGSGGFFVRDTRPRGVRFAKRCRASARGVVQSERFIEEHGGKLGNLSVYGQDQWAWGTHLIRAQRARRVRLRRRQSNQ